MLELIFLELIEYRFFRFVLIGLCAIYTLISEYAMIFITGWDRFGFIVLYGFVICILIGAVFMTIIQWIKNRNQNKNSANN